MKAVLFDRNRNPNYTDTLDLSIDKPDYIKVKVKSVGLCGSDVHRIGMDSNLEGKIFGHEVAGIVSEIGREVDTSLNGQRVAIVPFVPCYNCESCQNEKYALCNNLIGLGRGIRGGFAENIVIPASNAYPISKELSFDEAALTDVYAVALHAYNLLGKPKKKDILIFGNGPIGIACLQLLSIFGNKVSVVGRGNERYVIDNRGEYIPYQKANNIPSNSFDLIIEAVGGSQDETIKNSIRIVKPLGKIIVEGVFNEAYSASVPLRDLFYKEATVQGANSYSISDSNNEFKEALQLIEQHIVDPHKIISHILPLSQFKKGLELFRKKAANKAMKIVFHP